MSDSRERFEKWMAETWPTVVMNWNEEQNRYYYGGKGAQIAWEAWQAARRDALEEAAKLVESALPSADPLSAVLLLSQQETK